jgi:hypothetical protein
MLGMTDADLFLESGRNNHPVLNTGNFLESSQNSNAYTGDFDPYKKSEDKSDNEDENIRPLNDHDMKMMKEKMKGYHKFTANKSSPQVNGVVANHLRNTDDPAYNAEGDRPFGMVYIINIIIIFKRQVNI